MSSTTLNTGALSLTDLIDGFEHLKFNIQRKLGLVWEHERFTEAKKITLADKQIGFTEDDWKRLSRVWGVYLKVREVEYDLCREILTFAFRAGTGTAGTGTISQDKGISSLARSYINALLDEQKDKRLRTFDEERIRIVKELVLKRYVPILTTALKQANPESVRWQASLEELADFMETDLGQRLSALEIKWHKNLN